MALWARVAKVTMTTGTSDGLAQLMSRALMARATFGMVRDTPGQTCLSRMTLIAELLLRDISKVEAVRLVAVDADCLRCMETAFRARLLVALRALQSDLRFPFGMRIVTGHAVAIALDRVRRDDLLVAILAGTVSSGAHRVWFVATGAFAMTTSRPCENRRSFVAALAVGCP